MRLTRDIVSSAATPYSWDSPFPPWVWIAWSTVRAAASAGGRVRLSRGAGGGRGGGFLRVVGGAAATAAGVEQPARFLRHERGQLDPPPARRRGGGRPWGGAVRRPPPPPLPGVGRRL